METVPGQYLVDELESILHRLKRLYDNLSGEYPEDDLRLAAIGLPGNALHSYLLYVAMAESTIAKKSWWKLSYDKEEPNEKDMAAVRGIESLTKHSFFVFFFSRIEWNFRKLVTFLFPGSCGNGGAPFKSVYDFLLNKLELERYIPLYDTCRHVRNSIHSNGIYISRNGEDQLVSWKGRDYEFKHMQPVDFFSYDVLFKLYNDVIDSIEELLNHHLVKAPSFIEDKIH